MSNPLLSTAVLPAFSDIEAQHIKPALETILQENRRAIEALIARNPKPDWDNVFAPLEAMSDRLDRCWSPVSHLHGVCNTEALRAAYDECLPLLTEYSTELGQHQGLYALYKAAHAHEGFDAWPQAQRKSIENALRDFELSGIALTGEARERFSAIKLRQAELSTQFSNNVLDATQAWHKQITDLKQLAGIPESTLGLYRSLAEARELEGWVITLDFPSYLPLMQYCDNAALREEVYRAYISRASDCGPNAGQWDNSAVMLEIVQLRQELAQLLGFEHYAQRSLASKMAESPAQVIEFLNDLAQRSKTLAENEFQELQAFAAKQGQASLQAWDVAYFSEKLRESRYALSQEELRPYFPLQKVIDGLMAVTSRLFDIEFREENDVERWHDDVQFFSVLRKGEVIAQFYFDLFAREQKRGGAWMADCRVRRRKENNDLQLPVAFLTCNFTPATGDIPSLLTHNEVTTLFHEFGHGLHHMLTQIDVADVSGINGVAWDAVELPSQFLENWCWESEAIPMLSAHYESGAALPQTLLEKMLAAKNFQSGMAMVRQLEFGLFDFRLHMQDAPKDVAAIQAVLDEVRTATSVIPACEDNRFQHGFSHIFAGGYAAGYYSYKWAEVLSADAFSLFEEQGLFDKKTGQCFLREVLEMGGSREPMACFEAFRGRKPSVDALLRHCGIVESN